MRRPVSFRVATQHELAVVVALARVTMWPGSSAKRLIRDLNDSIGEAHLKGYEALDARGWGEIAAPAARAVQR